jgi:hypothetical protein
MNATEWLTRFLRPGPRLETEVRAAAYFQGFSWRVTKAARCELSVRREWDASQQKRWALPNLQNYPADRRREDRDRTLSRKRTA